MNAIRMILLLAGGFAGGVPLAAAASEPQTPPPLEHFARLPLIQDVRLSPSGRDVAFVVHQEGRARVVVQTVGDGRFRALLGNDQGNADINWISWANDRHLLVSVRFPARRWGTDTVETRLLWIDAEDGAMQPVFKPHPRDRLEPQFQDAVVDLLPDEPGALLMALDTERVGEPGVFRVELESGRRKLVQRPRAGFHRWLTDRQHRVRVGVRVEDDHREIHVFDLETRRWNPAWRFAALGVDLVHPLGFGQDPNQLYILAYEDDFLAIFRVDLAAPGLPRTLVYRESGQDVEGSLLYSSITRDVIGLRLSDGHIVVWDQSYAPFVRGLDGAFGTLNAWLLDFSRDERRYLILTRGVREPGTYYFGDRDQGTLTPIGRRYPDLDAEDLSGKRHITYRTRDGIDIDGFLTLPRGMTHRKLPTVILPHGGPIAADDLSFDYWSEFLSSRGYAVLQMNFRGSAGYGHEFMRAGFGSWGVEMQNDVEDGTRWMIDEGLADENRICIVGGSYGGYAALMGAIVTPDLYRCVVSFAAVTDVPDLVRYGRRYIGGKVLEEMVGSDLRALRSRSPVHLAAEIQAPVLIVHGDQDRSVRVTHGRGLRDAMERAGHRPQYLEYAGGDHFLSREAHRIDFFRAMEAFLHEHIGGARLTGEP